MLHYETIEDKLLGILRKLQVADCFSGLRLAGGTALALQMGHRKSIDLDLFGRLDADYLAIAESMSKVGEAILVNKSENINVWLVNGVKVDIVNYPYPWINGPILIDGLVLAGIEDIAAMKLAAITNRGTKKDFIDIFFLLRTYSIGELLDLYQRKYRDGSIFLVLKSLAYFEDADEQESPVMLQPAGWEETKQMIINSLKKYEAGRCPLPSH